MRPVRSPLERRRLSYLLPTAKQWIAVTNLNNGVSRVFVRRFVDLDTVYCLCSYDVPFSGTRSKTFYNGKEKVLGRDVKKWEKFGSFTFFYLLCRRKGALRALVRYFVPCLIGKIEALCSFLQGGNLRNFNHCKECLETARVLQRCSKTNEDGHSGFTHYCVELLLNTILFVWAILRAPTLKMWTYSSTLLV